MLLTSQPLLCMQATTKAPIMHQKQYVCSTRTCSLRNLQALFYTAFKGVLAGCLRLMMKPLCVLKSTVVVSVGDQHALLVTVSGGRAPSQTVLVGIETDDTTTMTVLGTS